MVASPSLSRNAVLESIWKTVPVGAQQPTAPKVLSKLCELTSDLIDICGRNSLRTDPFAEVYQRQIAIDLPKVTSTLANKVVLVTGGQGFVGTNLIANSNNLVSKRLSRLISARIVLNEWRSI